MHWLLLAAALTPNAVAAQQNTPRQNADKQSDARQSSERVLIGFEATASFWWTMHEEVQNGLVQAGSGDRADGHASGFSLCARHGA